MEGRKNEIRGRDAAAGGTETRPGINVRAKDAAGPGVSASNPLPSPICCRSGICPFIYVDTIPFCIMHEVKVVRC